MSEFERQLNQIIADNISNLLQIRNRTQLELAEHLGVTQATVSNWCNGVKMPRMDKIDRICAFFGVTRSDIMSEGKYSTYHSEDADGNTYYLDPEAAALAQELYERPEMRILFDASRNATKEDIEQVADILDKLSKN